MKHVALVLTLAAALPLAAQIDVGDRHYAQRAEGAQGARASAQHVDAAIAAFQRAIAQNPNDLEAHARLLRAIRFKGAYVAASNEEKKQIYGAAKKAGDAALAVIDRHLAPKGLKRGKSTNQQIADAMRNVPGAGAVFLWDAINWGEWALAYGKLAAAREGAADRIRHQAMIAHLIDPRLEMGAPSRVLGRLHDQTPRIPFLTGWASSKEAVKFLQESRKHDPDNKVTLVFLAEAMVGHDGKTKPQAIQILREVVAKPLHPEYVVEDAGAVNDARALLKKWGG
jgi:tetratricopeptide (TPR) repeat protein